MHDELIDIREGHAGIVRDTFAPGPIEQQVAVGALVHAHRIDYAEDVPAISQQMRLILL
jgi:hypothetical protein